MNQEEHTLLSTLTTFAVGGPARFVVTAATPDEVRTAAQFAKEQGLPFRVLGEGSNVLASDAGYDGVIIKMAIPGISFSEMQAGVEATVGAGVHWDSFVDEAAKRELWGIENLAGIPGTTGATPVQNIGAYGTEVRSTITSVSVYDAHADTVRAFTNEECRFAYRDSIFKHEDSLIILSVTFLLSSHGEPQLTYSDLKAARERGEDLTTPTRIGAVVRAIRAQKFPDLREFGTAGSFFKNPILSEQTYEALTARYGAIPRFPNPDGVKIPLAFVLDKVLGLRGHREGKVWLFGNQPLVVVADRGATGAEIDAFVTRIAARVYEETGITIEREVRSLP